MSEYWVSKKKYFCKYCDIYIQDDAPSRNQHETGLRHKGNRDRFVRSLYKDGERRKKDLAEEKREVARIEEVREYLRLTLKCTPDLFMGSVGCKCCVCQRRSLGHRILFIIAAGTCTKTRHSKAAKARVCLVELLDCPVSRVHRPRRGEAESRIREETHARGHGRVGGCSSTTTSSAPHRRRI